MIGYITLGVLALIFAAFLVVVGVRYKNLAHKSKKDNIKNDDGIKDEPSDELVDRKQELEDEIAHLQEELDMRKKGLDASCRSQSAAISQLDGVLNQLARWTVEQKEVGDALQNAASSLSMAKLEISNFERTKQDQLHNYQLELLSRQKEIDEYNASVASLTSTINILQSSLSSLRSLDLIVMERHKEAMVRAYELSQGKSGVLRFAQRELLELKELRDVVCKLSNPAPLNKAIYEMYYREKMKEMQANLGIGARVCGIYRLWMEIDGVEVCYVGQSVDVGERWIQHLKRFVGSEPATGIKLYKDERVDLSKLKWEVIEECEQGELGEREKYWIGFYNCGGGWNSRV